LLREQVVGSNGLVAGLVPLLLGSFMADFRAMTLPLLQLLVVVLAVSLHVVVAVMQACSLLLQGWSRPRFSAITDWQQCLALETARALLGPHISCS
jgi:hypothetical protein